MLNRRSIDAVAAAAAGPHEVRPLYDSYCFSRISWTIEAALTGEPNPRTLPPDTLGALADRPDTVVLLFVDAFGWRFFEEFAESTPALARFLRDGTVSKLTAVFPSTTSAHVACLHSGLTPAESGIYEWYQYEPAVGEMIAPLLSSRAGDKGRTGSTFRPETLFDGETLHERLAARGVRSFSVTPAEFTPSPFNDAFTRGTVDVPYKGLARGLNALARLVTEPGGTAPRLIHYYYGGVDRIAHRSGPGSPELRETVRRFFTELERRFFGVLERARSGGSHGSRAQARVPGAGTGAGGRGGSGIGTGRGIGAGRPDLGRPHRRPRDDGARSGAHRLPEPGAARGGAVDGTLAPAGGPRSRPVPPATSSFTFAKTASTRRWPRSATPSPTWPRCVRCVTSSPPATSAMPRPRAASSTGWATRLSFPTPGAPSGGTRRAGSRAATPATTADCRPRRWRFPFGVLSI